MVSYFSCALLLFHLQRWHSCLETMRTQPFLWLFANLMSSEKWQSNLDVKINCSASVPFKITLQIDWKITNAFVLQLDQHWDKSKNWFLPWSLENLKKTEKICSFLSNQILARKGKHFWGVTQIIVQANCQNSVS